MMKKSYDYVNLGKRIRELRKLNQLTQMELADLTGISYVYVSKIENGQAYPGLEIISEIAEAVGVTIDYLIRGERSVDTDIYITVESRKKYELLKGIMYLLEIYEET